MSASAVAPGLYFTLPVKRLNAAHRIKVVERNRPDDTFGRDLLAD